MLTALSFLCKVHSLIHPDGRMEEMEILNVKNQRDVVPRSPRILENKYCSKKSNLFNVQSEFCVRLTNPAAAAAATAAKSLQSCLTLCNPMDCSLPGFFVHGIFQQEYWSRLPFPSPGDLPDPGIEPRSPTIQAGTLPSEPPGKPCYMAKGD